jgi:hypothetical protein
MHVVYRAPGCIAWENRMPGLWLIVTVSLLLMTACATQRALTPPPAAVRSAR